MMVSASSEIDKASLQEYVLKKLKESRDRASYIVQTSGNEDFWRQLHQVIVNLSKSQEKNQMLKAEKQLTGLVEYIDGWISSAVESGERFDFFIMAKAQEVASGDQDKDYYWALQIRHDQLIALVNVVTKLLDHMERLVKLDVNLVLEDPVVLGLTDYSIEDQVYLEAEKVHEERKKFTD